MNEAVVLDAVESTFVIVFLILSILSVKKFIKSLLLNCEEYLDRVTSVYLLI